MGNKNEGWISPALKKLNVPNKCCKLPVADLIKNKIIVIINKHFEKIDNFHCKKFVRLLY